MDVNRAMRMVDNAVRRWTPGRNRIAERGPEHRTIVVIDMAGFGRWNNREQLGARAALSSAVHTALRTSGVARSRPAIEDRGDGMILLIPATLPAVSKVDVLDPMIPDLTAAIRRHNATVVADQRIRLRVSVHAGEVHRDASGWVGTDLNLACRLVNAESVYQHLRQHPHADLVLIVSALIHHGVVGHGYRDIDPATYVPVTATVKEVDTSAWIHVPSSSRVLHRIPMPLVTEIRRHGS